MEVGLNAALWVAVAAPVAVVCWSMWFAARAALSGPAWALAHLRLALTSLASGLIIALLAALVVRPSWMSLGVAYPFAVGTWMASTRRRQLAVVEKDGGFGEIDPQVRFRLSRGLGRSLRIAGAVAWFTGLAVVALGVAQGWLIVALGPIAILIAMFVTRRTVEPTS
ncbi:MAG: hypothetical protein Q8Q52_06330 [Acidimicrobiia bacterium]|nr:hypothetical protein [Acidimicrobiia bacterium]